MTVRIDLLMPRKIWVLIKNVKLAGRCRPSIYAQILLACHSRWLWTFQGAKNFFLDRLANKVHIHPNGIDYRMNRG